MQIAELFTDFLNQVSPHWSLALTLIWVFGVALKMAHAVQPRMERARVEARVSRAVARRVHAVIAGAGEAL